MIQEFKILKIVQEVGIRLQKVCKEEYIGKSIHHPLTNSMIYTIIANEVSLLRESMVTFSLYIYI